MNGPNEEKNEQERERDQDNDANAEVAADAMKDTCDDILTRMEGLEPNDH